MASTEKKNLPAETSGNSMAANVPAYLQDKGRAVLPGVDASDLILPRIKLLQGLSPEVETYEAAKVGLFWHSVLGEPIGNEFRFIVASYRKKYLLLAPLGDARKVLARAEDGVHWTPPNAKFDVKLKGVRETQTWETKPTVRESGLAEFGSSISGDPDSPPAAVLIHEYMLYLPDFPHWSPIIMSLARSQVKKAKDLNSKITFRGQALEGMAFKATVIDDRNADNQEFKNYQFLNDGFATEDEYNTVVEIGKQFGGNYKVHDEENVAAEHEGGAGGDATRKDI